MSLRRRKNTKNNKKERLFKYKELKMFFSSSKKTLYKGLKLLYKENRLKGNRIVFIVRKGFKKAVKRNRQKRLVKEAYHNIKEDIETGYDFIILISAFDYNYHDRLHQVERIFNFAKLMKKSK